MKTRTKRGFLLMVLFALVVGVCSPATCASAVVKRDRKEIVRSNEQVSKLVERAKKNENNRRIMNHTELEAFLQSDSENALIGKTEEEVELFFSSITSGKEADNTRGGVITNPVTYLRNTVGKSTDTYNVSKTQTISGVSNKTLSALGGGNNCTLTALYNIMVYYRGKGYDKIPSNSTKLYDVIKSQATALGYTTEKGIGVTKNDSLVTNTWRSGFGYSSGSGSNDYLWTGTSMISDLDNKKPIMFSLASGAYFDHTVAVYGYKIYKNKRTGVSYTFLMVRDGWSTSTRYLAWTNTGESYVGCVTSVNAP